MTEKMKPSGIAWIGDIPQDWECKRFRFCGDVQYGYPFNSDYFSSEETGFPLIRIRDITSGEIATYYEGTYHDEYIVKSGDVLVGMDGDFNVRVWANCDALLNQRCCRVLDSQQISKRFMAYYLPHYLKVINDLTWSTTVKHLLADDINNIYVAYPQMCEQQAIADFLDVQCAKIDSVIADIEKQIETLQKYKKSLITEAVTKGLDHSVSMKDSRCKWASRIPAHWSIKRFKYLLDYITDGSHFSPETVDEGYPYITAADVRGLGLDYQAAKKISNQDFIALQRTGCQPKVGDVLLVKDGATTGRVGMVTSDYPCVVLSSVAILRVPGNMDCRYLRYLMESEFVQSQIQASMAGSAMPRTVLSKIVNYLGIECPQSEQIQICDYLDETCANIDGIVSIKGKQLEAIKQHKKSLIYEYVTGKKRVTEVN